MFATQQDVNHAIDLAATNLHALAVLVTPTEMYKNLEFMYYMPRETGTLSGREGTAALNLAMAEILYRNPDIALAVL